MNHLNRSWLFALSGALVVVAVPIAAQSVQSKADQVTITGGHETDPRDHGRPVVLIAAGLGVPSEVFREAFSHVTPAHGGREPDPEQVHRNKDALLSALGQYGVTNDLLDRVSDNYRYNERRGETWAHRDAIVKAVRTKGVITGFQIVDGGAGYSSIPSLSMPGLGEVKVTLAFGRDLRKNGSIASIILVKKKVK